MTETISIIMIVILVLILVVQLYIVFRPSARQDSSRLESSIKEEFSHTREEINNVLGNRIDNMTKINEEKLENIRRSVEDRLTHIEKDNGEKLEKMREVVDEKLNSTLEERLSKSFSLVNERLESVYKGLGEMQTLANGVGDLKRVLTNVKTRGTWGEVQLSNILSEFMHPDQYEKNVKIKPRSSDFVEFAIKIPSRNDDTFMYLPIDSKFPIESYEKLVQASEAADAHAVKLAKSELAQSIKIFAGQIRDKYIDPPKTTDFGIMFLPIESLYCEVVSNTTLCETLQRDYHVVVTGPTTFTAIINSLQLGFTTLAVQKRTGEVWELLGKIKTEFGKFGDLLDKTNKKISEIGHTIRDAAAKSRNIERKLKNVNALPLTPADEIEFNSIPFSDDDDDAGEDE